MEFNSPAEMSLTFLLIIFSSIFITVCGAGIVNLLLELKRDLMMMQQNSYRNERYMRWLHTSGDTTSLIRLFAIIILGAIFYALQSSAIAGPIIYLPAAYVVLDIFYAIHITKLCRAKYKKPLVWTPRARRIYAVAVGISLVAATLPCLFAGGIIDYILSTLGTTLLVLYLLSHVIIMAAVWILKPVEARINRRYYDEAASILRSMPDLKVIGITGSYGKTSTKHYLNRILQEGFSVTMTPGSFNTTMGVIRTVREYLKPYDEIFICEMGAKNIGDIKEICDLVNPSIGIITAVGEQHLESFKTVENVQRTKFELADALPADGFVMVNCDFPHAASRPVANTERVGYGISATEADYRATDIVYGRTGTRFNIVTPTGETLPFETRLVGECNISNLIPAIAIALRLGMTPEKVRYAVGRVEQVEHRLNMKSTPGGITIIDDAFNSNPHGSRMALDVLKAMDSGRRIVVTPGMIELGDRQYDANREFGLHMASCADIAIIVGEYNRDSILSGLRDGGMPEEQVHAVDTFAEAQQVLAANSRPGDTVLYENDLPDTFK